MTKAIISNTPNRTSYDIVIVGGAMYGSAVAWFLADNPDFDGSILVIERDPSYANSATAHTNSCIRQQFSNPLNVKISQFGAEFIKGFRQFMGNDPRIPELTIQSYGYMYFRQHRGLRGSIAFCPVGAKKSRRCDTAFNP